MTTPVPVARPAPALIALAITAVAVPLALAAGSTIPALPAPLVVVLALAAAGAAIGLMVLLAKRSRSAPGGRRVLRVTGLVALALSVVAALWAAAIALGHDPLPSLLGDVGSHARLLVVLLLIAVPSRTVGWLPLLGTLLCGSLAVVAAARAVGVPVVTALGVGDPLATSIWVPLTEELLKVMPAAIVALLALRNRVERPAALDIGVLGAASGAGFGIAENAAYGGVFSRGDTPFPFSFLVPTLQLAGRGDVFHVFAGHAVWTALLGLGLGFSVLYGRRHRFAWVAAPAAFLVVFAEHAIYNLAGAPPVLLVPVAGGMLSSVLLLAGFVVLAVGERRRPLGRAGLVSGLGVTSAVAQRTALAARQRRTDR